MVILKKIKASSIIEVLTASVLIVVVFMVASLILNTIFKNTVINTDQNINHRIKELHYLYLHEKIVLPYDEEINGYSILMEMNKEQLLISYGKEGTDFTEVTLQNIN